MGEESHILSTPITEGSSELPEEFQGKTVEDVVQSLMDLRQSHEQELEKLAPLIQTQRELEPYGGIDALKQSYAQLFNSYQQHYAQNGQDMPANQPAQPTQAQPSQWDSNWDYLTPREQAERMQATILEQVQNYINQAGQQLYQEATQRLETQHGALRREFDIFRGLLDIQKTHPGLDSTKLLEQAVQISQSNPTQLLQLATQALANQDGAETKRLATEQFEQWKADETLRRQNEQLQSLQNPGGSTFHDRFSGQSDGGDAESRPTAADVHRQVVEKLVGDPASGLTMAHFTG
jgi:hypothetical protein